MDVNDTVNTGDDFSAYAAGYKIFTGYNFGKIPLFDLAIEGSYIFTGEISDDVNGVDVTYEQSSFNGFGLAGLRFDPFGIFGKLGVGAWNSDIGTSEETDAELHFKRQYNDLFMAHDIAEPLLSFDAKTPVWEVTESLGSTTGI